jgi:hypothetical protein
MAHSGAACDGSGQVGRVLCELSRLFRSGTDPAASRIGENMSPTPTIFPSPPAPAPAPAVEATQIVETLGIEVLEESLDDVEDAPKAPANGNDVIPFASTLRRVG